MVKDETIENGGDDGYPIRVVAERTGLSPHVIRVWERRYEAVNPRRLDNGYRQYSERDVDRLRALRELTEAGHGIGDVARLPDRELGRMVGRERALHGEPPDPRLSDATARGDLTVPVVQAALERAVVAWDWASLVAGLREAALRLPLDTFLEDVLIGLLRRIGHGWETGELSPATEHMVSAAVPGMLDWVSERLERPRPDAPLAVLATPTGERHDLGARVAAVVARSAGWRTLFLGADLPAADIARAVHENDADLVALSIVFQSANEGVAAELARLVAQVGDDVEIVLGGAAAASYADSLDASGAAIIRDLGELRARLRTAA